MFKSLIKNFLQGLVLLGPIAVTAYCVYIVVYKLDTAIPSLSKISPGISLISIVSFITFIGFIGEKFFLTRWLIALFDGILEKIPGVKFIYTSTKDIIASFLGDKKKFNNPVWVKTNENPTIWRIGFLTQPKLTLQNMENNVAVYLPHSYAISGWVIITSIDNIIPIKDLDAAEAMKLAVSGGASFNELNINEKD